MLELYLHGMVMAGVTMVHLVLTLYVKSITLMVVTVMMSVVYL